MPNDFIPSNFEDILNRQRQVESSGKPGAISPKGAMGLGQIMPDTAKRYGYKPEDMLNPEKSMYVQRRYMTDLLNKYQGDVSKALAAYNFGEGRIDKGEKLPQETRNYITKMMAGLGTGTASAAEPPAGMGGMFSSSVTGDTSAPDTKELQQLHILPQFRTATPEQQQRIEADFRNRSSEVQRQFLQTALKNRPALNPLDWPSKVDYLAQVRQLSGYRQNENPVYRDKYLQKASQWYNRAWAGRRETSTSDSIAGPGSTMAGPTSPFEGKGVRQQYEQAEERGAQYPIIGSLPGIRNTFMGKGQEYPAGTKPRETSMFGDMAPWDRWWAQNIGKPIQRAGTAGLVSAYESVRHPFSTQGAEQTKDAWTNPSHFPTARYLAAGGPIMDVKDPESIAMAYYMTKLGSIARMYDWGPWRAINQENKTLWRLAEGAAKGAGRVGVSAAGGAGINLARSAATGDPTPMMAGGIVGGAAQLGEEGITQAVNRGPGAARAVGRKATQILGLGKPVEEGGARAGYFKALTEQITHYLPGLRNELKGENTYTKVLAAPNHLDPKGNSVSLPQKQTREATAVVERQMKTAMLGKTYDVEVSPTEAKELYGAGATESGKMPGFSIPGRGEGGSSSAPVYSYRPKVGEATPAGEKVIPAEKTKIYMQGKKGRFGKWIEAETSPEQRMPVPESKPYYPQASRPAMQRVTFDEANQIVNDARDIGWSMKGLENYDRTGVPVMMRSLSKRVVREVGEHMHQMGMGDLGNAWMEAKFREQAADLYTNLMREDGVHQGLKVGKEELQNTATLMDGKGYYHDFIELFGEKYGYQALKQIMDGAEPHMLPSQRGGVEWRLRFHLGGYAPTVIPHVQLPYAAKAIRPQIEPKALGFMSRLGAQGVARYLLEMSGADDPSLVDTSVLDGPR